MMKLLTILNLRSTEIAIINNSLFNKCLIYILKIYIKNNIIIYIIIIIHVKSNVYV